VFHSRLGHHPASCIESGGPPRSPVKAVTNASNVCIFNILAARSNERYCRRIPPGKPREEPFYVYDCRFRNLTMKPSLSLTLLCCVAFCLTAPPVAAVSHTSSRSYSISVTPTTSESPTMSPPPPSPRPPPSYNPVVAKWSVCGNGVCEGTSTPTGETCGTCPVDCGPCQPLEDVTNCTAPLKYAMAFDGGPSALTPNLLNILDSFNIKASFFVTANRLQWFTPQFSQEIKRGHSTFFNSYTGSDLTTMRLENAQWEFGNATSAIRAASCKRPVLFRPPYGSIDDSVRNLAHNVGLRAVRWNLDTFDWLYASTDPIEMLTLFKLNLEELYPQSVVQLQLDFHQESIDRVSALITQILVHGYQFVTMEECVWGPKYQLNPSWVFMNSQCGKTDWRAIARVYRGTDQHCPVSEWSEWSGCSASCGVGKATRIRYSFPPSAEFYDPECVSVAFMETRTCVIATVCPTHVWNGTYTDTDGNGLTVDIMKPKMLPTTVCAFGGWRWGNTSVSCSKQCGIGTAVRIRDFVGFGQYSHLCGPMVELVTCQVKACPLDRVVLSSMDYTMRAFNYMIGVGSFIVIGVVFCHASPYFCLGYFRRTFSRTAPWFTKSASSPPPAMSSMHAPMDAQFVTASTAGKTPVIVEQVPLDYFDGGNVVGGFVVRKCQAQHDNAAALRRQQSNTDSQWSKRRLRWPQSSATSIQRSGSRVRVLWLSCVPTVDEEIVSCALCYDLPGPRNEEDVIQLVWS
jgi:peptidoglycan/xylan/chitin deacetylase (PgdA/CDA1 family)